MFKIVWHATKRNADVGRGGRPNLYLTEDEAWRIVDRWMFNDKDMYAVVRANELDFD